MGFFSKKQATSLSQLRNSIGVGSASTKIAKVIGVNGNDVQTKVAAMNTIMESWWAANIEYSPTNGTYAGQHDHDDKWQDLSEQSVATFVVTCEKALVELQSKCGVEADLIGWPAQDVITYKVLKDIIEGEIKSNTLGCYFNEHSSMWGFLTDLPSLIEMMQYKNQTDYEKFSARMNALPAHVDQLIDRLRLGMSKNMTPARISVVGCDEQIRGMVTQEPSPLAEPLLKFDDVCPNAEALKSSIKRAVTSTVPKALNKLADFVRDEYIPGCSDVISIVERLPNGEEVYAFVLEQNTSTKMTAQEIHDVGQSEVKRIFAAMKDIANSEGFTGEDALDKYTESIMNDTKYVANSPEALINHFRVLAMVISPNLSKLFGKLPRTTFGIRPIPEYRAESAAGAYYMPPSDDGSQPGYFYANCSDLPSRKLYAADALVLHEAIPGHHMQIALAIENKELPMIRRIPSYTAYIEGWGLYSETLGAELGVYMTPATRYGKLSEEMLRACRLVVDTGMHAFGWTKQEAMDFAFAHKAASLKEIDAETTRYVSIPGQATAYKVGEMKILQLRKRATEELGYAFDIRKFHDLVLSFGAVPLTVLEQSVDEWIASLMV